MTRDYDTQLLESVAARRRRLRDAILFGSLAIRRTFKENVGRAIAGVALAAVIAAGCVGWSYIQKAIKRPGGPFGPAPVQTTPTDR